MEKPLIGGFVPYKFESVVGQTYYYCTCGRSSNGALCDGSHKGTGLTPKAFVAQREKSVLCTCKRSAEAPYCDGSHRGLTEKEVGSIA